MFTFLGIIFYVNKCCNNSLGARYFDTSTSPECFKYTSIWLHNNSQTRISCVRRLEALLFLLMFFITIVSPSHFASASPRCSGCVRNVKYNGFYLLIYRSFYCNHGTAYYTLLFGRKFWFYWIHFRVTTSYNRNKNNKKRNIQSTE